jgi:Galactose oxidase, central domain
MGETAMRNSDTTGLFCSMLLLAGAAAGGEAVKKPDPKSMPANTWVKAVSDNQGSPYQALIYDPVRGGVMQWANTPTDRTHNAIARVRHFDPAKMAWVDDYPGVKNGRPAGYNSLWKMAGAVPRAGSSFDMVAFVPKLKEVIYAQPGMMAAYNPATKKWREEKAHVELYGAKYAGGPPFAWGAMAYDPVNDELVMFSHAGALNCDDLETTGFVGGHMGTMIYSLKQKLWKRQKPGSAEFKKARGLLRDVWYAEGKVVKEAWRAELQKAWKPAEHKKLSAVAAKTQAEVLAMATKAAAEVKALAGKVTNAEEKTRLALAVNALSVALGEMKKSRSALASGNSYAGYLAAFNLTQKLRHLYRFKVRAEPPERLNSRLAFDPKTKSLVLFGGNHGDGYWNDTWIYDCKTRRWRESKSATRPAPREQHFIVHHAKSGRILMGGGTLGVWRPYMSDVWTYDVASDKWQQHAAAAPGKKRGSNRYSAAYDAKSDLLVMHCADYRSGKSTTWVCRFAPAPVAAKSASPWAPPLPEAFPRPDNPAILAKLKSLPANQWIDSKCPDRAPRKDWGSIGYDPSSGFALLFGGGHSTYQGDDITVYLPGANRWIYSHKPIGAAILPQYKNCMGGGIPGVNYNGGLWTMHQRNTYDAADGVMVLSLMSSQAYPYGPASILERFRKSNTRWAPWKNALYEYDLAVRLWRKRYPENSEKRIGNMFPMGDRIGGLLSNGWREFTPGTDKIIDHVSKGKLPNRSGEGRHYAYIPGKHQVLLVCNSKSAPVKTYLYDLKTGEVRDLKPKRSPPASVRVYNVLYLPDQDCAWARIRAGGGQWLYSFKKNTWVEAPFKAPTSRRAFTGPYGKEVYSAKYGVLICGNGTPTYLLRPDFSKINWEQK